MNRLVDWNSLFRDRTAVEVIPPAVAGGTDLTATAKGSFETVQGTSEIVKGKSEMTKGNFEKVEGTSEIVKGKSETVEGSSEIVEGSSEIAEGTSEIAKGKPEIAEWKSEVSKSMWDRLFRLSFVLFHFGTGRNACPTWSKVFYLLPCLPPTETVC
jgi:hypothetical protein